MIKYTQTIWIEPLVESEFDDVRKLIDEEMVKFKKALRRLGRGKVRFSINELRMDVMVVR